MRKSCAKSSSKLKKDAGASEGLADIPAYALFCVSRSEKTPYVWQSWGLIIRHLRDFAGMDQAVFGRLLKGYTRGHISRYEAETSEPPIDFWVKMMRTFGLNITWAMTGVGEPYTKDCQDCEERKRFYEWVRLIDEKEDFLRELRGQ